MPAPTRCSPTSHTTGHRVASRPRVLSRGLGGLIKRRIRCFINNLALLLREQGDFAEARPVHERALR